MKKVFSCFSPKGSPDRNRNPRATATTGTPPRLASINTQTPTADGPTSTPVITWLPASAPSFHTSPVLSPTPVPSSAPASTAASTSTNREKSEEEEDSRPDSPATRARIDELTAEVATLNLNLGPMPIQKFPFIQLQYATANFSPESCLGRGGFGKVYRGNLAPQNLEVAIKRLNPKSDQGTPEFVTEVELLSNVDHKNFVRLIGYCAENEHRMLVYEYVSNGSLEGRLLKHGPDHHVGALGWNTRLRIAYEIAQGVHYLHSNMQPPRIYRDLKCANILLGEGYTVKLSDFGCAKKAAPKDDELNLTRVLGTQGYLDPRYFATGNCTFGTDIYSFGVVLLELVTGRKCIDSTRPPEERSLLMWARRVFNNRARFGELVDPFLEGKFQELGLHTLVTMAKYCVDLNPDKRPRMSHIVDILGQLNRAAEEPDSPRVRRLTRNPTLPSSSAARDTSNPTDPPSSAARDTSNPTDPPSSAARDTSSPKDPPSSAGRVTFRL